MQITDLGQLDYRSAWKIQEQAHEKVLAGGEEQLLLVEHLPVITFGRRPGVSQHLIATPEQLRDRNVEVIESDRGGDITFHGPGQIVAYPIIRLADHKLSISGYVHRLEEILIATLKTYGIESKADPAAVGVWVGSAKIAAIGVRVRRGATLHGLALNVTTDLSFFDLIVPCGLTGRAVTSIQQLLPTQTPTIDQVKQTLIGQFQMLL